MVNCIKDEIPKAAFKAVIHARLNKHYANLVFNMESFQRWLRLSIDGKEDVRTWFDLIVSVDPDVFDATCQKIMRKLLEFLARSLVNVNDVSNAYEYLLRNFQCGLDFSLLCDEMPNGATNRLRCIFLWRCLSEQLQDWFVGAAAEKAAKIRGTAALSLHSAKAISRDNEIVLVQRFVGSAISERLSLFRKQVADGTTRHRGVDPAGVVQILEDMCFNRVAALKDEEYVRTYYPATIRHLNQGGWCLLKKGFMAWGIMVMSLIRKSMTIQTGIAYRREVIAKGYEYVFENQGLRRKFDKIISNLCRQYPELYSRDCALVVYKELVDFAYHAYTKWRFKTIVKNLKQKDNAGNDSNVAFLHSLASKASRKSGRSRKAKASSTCNGKGNKGKNAKKISETSSKMMDEYRK